MISVLRTPNIHRMASTRSQYSNPKYVANSARKLKTDTVSICEQRLRTSYLGTDIVDDKGVGSESGNMTRDIEYLPARRLYLFQLLEVGEESK